MEGLTGAVCLLEVLCSDPLDREGGSVSNHVPENCGTSLKARVTFSPDRLGGPHVGRH